jgi:thymidine phosphorylase
MSSYFPQEIIRKKRDGGELTADELAFFVHGLTDGSISEGQVAALAMAVFFRGMSMDERVALTRAMTHSGHVLDWSDAGFDKPIVDKHSSGGVGDKVSLVLAPVLAACGAVVPMISGRGLGHTGGTLDKLEAIPGYDAKPDEVKLRRVLLEAGCAIIGQTADVAPADRRFYAIRDVTATVESIPLITASILSKKLAAGLHRLVMDVKWGSGAFCHSFEMAQELAASIVAVADGAGLPTSALVTDMNQVLGFTAGNALETREAIAHLVSPLREPRLHEITVQLCAELLVGVLLAPDLESARVRVEGVLADGSAAEHFGRMVAALGGPADLLDRPDDHLPRAPVEHAVMPPRRGFVRSVDTRAIGMAVMGLGGGRRRADDDIDPLVGLSAWCPIGAEVGPDQAICRVHARTEGAAEDAARSIRAAVELSDTPPAIAPAITKRIPSPRPSNPSS